MNRRTFLKILGTLPTLSLVPSLVLAEEEIPEVLEVLVKLNSFGGRIPKFRFKTETWMEPAYITEVGPILEKIESSKYGTHFTYTVKVKILNTAKFKQSKIKIVAVNDSMWITT